ncbi:post-transcriptional regulator [Alicyclobacillus ferrooxydans]|nr:post-transcriptional regulator [Alicyclobacillus ferrooxydans]
MDTELTGLQPEVGKAAVWEDYTDEIRRLCEMKADDFHLLGYEEVEPAEIWECVNSSLKGQVRLHDVVAGVLGLQVGKFMNWMTMQAYRGTLTGDDSPFKL